MESSTTSRAMTTSRYSGNGYDNGSTDVIRRSNNYNNSLNNNNGGGEVNGNTISNGGSHRDSKFEVPLPFGYHMDLDFLRFCSDDQVQIL